MPETPQGFISEVPAHLRVDAGETQTTPEADAEAVKLELGERVAREVVVVKRGEPVVVERPEPIRTSEADATPQMKANALGSPYTRVN